MKRFFLILLTLAFFKLSHGQNLLDLSDWKVGSGSITGFSQNGSTSENVREWGIGPHGNPVILWKAIPDANNDGDGGFNTDYLPIDHSKMYRLSIWIKKTNSNNGTTYFGTHGSPDPVLTLNGTPHPNPYFFSSDLTSLDTWYLLVAHIHGSGDNSTVNYGGIYDGNTGQKVRTLNDFKFQTTTTSLNYRAYLFYDTETADRQYFYAPRIDEINGNEPTIAELLGIIPNGLEDLRVGTDNLPSGYKLSVGGDAIMEKVKVQQEESWPDYVFAKEHKLMAISDLEAFIKENQHLPNIPSAQEISENNQDLGLIQLKLLEKIEELTLYTIEQEKELAGMKILKEENKVLKEMLADLLARIEAIEKDRKDEK